MSKNRQELKDFIVLRTTMKIHVKMLILKKTLARNIPLTPTLVNNICNFETHRF